jgi:hypothetical protein
MTASGEGLGFGLAITANLIGPRRIVMGGVLSASMVYMDAARRVFNELLLANDKSLLVLSGKLAK